METDLFIGVEKSAMNPFLKEVILKNVLQLRQCIMDYNQKVNDFITSLTPLPMDVTAPPIVQEMLKAGLATGIGPMGGVAGGISKFVGEMIHPFSKELIVENGGDLLIKTKQERRIGIHTGSENFKDLGIIIHPMKEPLGVCTSSGTMGHSLSFGKAETVTVISKNPTLADTGATALCNRIKTKDDIEKGIQWIKGIPEVMGALIIIEDQLGAWGEIELG
ncbi:MAG: UPF0280 family protein [Eubacteriaceae bacterium]